ncbi:hypothetical protein OROMI_029237 [Orobanche minor]
MDKLKKIVGGKKKSKTPESGDSTAASNRGDPVGRYIEESNRRIRGIIESSGLKLKDGNLYKTDDTGNISRRLSYDVVEPNRISVRNSGTTTASILQFTNDSLFFTASG